MIEGQPNPEPRLLTLVKEYSRPLRIALAAGVGAITLACTPVEHQDTIISRIDGPLAADEYYRYTHRFPKTESSNYEPTDEDRKGAIGGVLVVGSLALSFWLLGKNRMPR